MAKYYTIRDILNVFNDEYSLKSFEESYKTYEMYIRRRLKQLNITPKITRKKQDNGKSAKCYTFDDLTTLRNDEKCHRYLINNADNPEFAELKDINFEKFRDKMKQLKIDERKDATPELSIFLFSQFQKMKVELMVEGLFETFVGKFNSSKLLEDVEVNFKSSNLDHRTRELDEAQARIRNYKAYTTFNKDIKKQNGKSKYNNKTNKIGM